MAQLELSSPHSTLCLPCPPGTGRALLSRLAYIYSSCPSLRAQTAAIALPLVKAQTYDAQLWDSFGGPSDDPWRRQVHNVARNELDKLETELKTVQGNLIKESIRVSTARGRGTGSRGGEIMSSELTISLVCCPVGRV